MPFCPKNKKNVDRIAMVTVTQANWEPAFSVDIIQNTSC